jgi:hypothetical protein
MSQCLTSRVHSFDPCVLPRKACVLLDPRPSRWTHMWDSSWCGRRKGQQHPKPLMVVLPVCRGWFNLGHARVHDGVVLLAPITHSRPTKSLNWKEFFYHIQYCSGLVEVCNKLAILAAVNDCKTFVSICIFKWLCMWLLQINEWTWNSL